ncbi:MAG TPA: aminopeptidase P family protein [Dehalococcoidia bacterium]|nr:aminopeptidase P family protein [Dehalococcoidia bacterium]
MNQRLANLRVRMAEVGLDGLLVSAPVEDTFKNVGANRRYLSGFTGSVGTLLMTAEAALIAVDFRYYEQAQREAPDFALFPAVGPLGTWFGSLVGTAGLAGKTLGFQPGDLTVATYQAMTKAVKAMPATDRPKLLAGPPLVEQMRSVKDAEELAALQRAVDLADEAFEAVARRIEPGWTETQVAWEIEKHVREHGGDALSFETIVASGPWSAMPHAYPRAEKRIEAGEPIIIDMGARVDGYCSDLSRTLILGKADSQFAKIYDIVLAAQEAGEALIRAGMSGEEAHMTAHNVIAEAGYGETFGHGLGHGVGLQVHEAPRLARTSKDVLTEGMVFTVEPGIYVSGWGGVRIEDMAVMENGRPRVLSRAPKVSVP